MSDITPAIWQAIINDARRYPSPHNSQPIKIKILNDGDAGLYYDLDLGLPAESYGIPFAHVCAGVFLESLSIVAAKKGYKVHETVVPTELNFGASNRLHRFANVSLSARKVTDRDVQTYDAFMRRQTSRRPYDSRLVPELTIEELQRIAASGGYMFRTSSDKQFVKDIVHINQSTLFDDLQNDAVYTEIMQWLRFSHSQAEEKKDGLSAETMLIPGKLLHFSMRHRGMWSLPIVGDVIRWAYLRTMKGVSQIGWIEGPFARPGDYISAGRTFMKLWIELTLQGVYIHPFGTVITNPKSHAKFVQKAGITERDGHMAWMLFRFGYSKQPPQAFKRMSESMIVNGGYDGSN
ncbi:hypothetical protein H7142_00870 [Candidatus Saccharibacteria bacterium]|nr:hypothetical protein [Candidatus Saccharibacteria bacterium]